MTYLSDDDDGLSELERQRRAMFLRGRRDPVGGVYVLHGEFDLITGAEVFEVLEAATER